MNELRWDIVQEELRTRLKAGIADAVKSSGVESIITVHANFDYIKRSGTDEAIGVTVRLDIMGKSVDEMELL